MSTDGWISLALTAVFTPLLVREVWPLLRVSGEGPRIAPDHQRPREGGHAADMEGP